MANKILKIAQKGLREILRYMPAKKQVNIPVLYGELLKGRTALITGGASGIGYAIADAFARNGCNIIITGRNESKLQQARECIQRMYTGIDANYIVFDIRDVKNHELYLSKILEISNNKVDIFVNNAGVLNQSKFGYVDEQDYDTVMETDLKAPYFFSQQISKYMISNKIQGNILNIVSSSSIRPALNSYHFAKRSMYEFTKGLAKELSQYDIVVNGIAPGPTATEMLMGENDKNINRPSSPSKRYAVPEEIGNLAVIMVSDLARMVNGDTLFVTGGSGVLTYDDWD